MCETFLNVESNHIVKINHLKFDWREVETISTSLKRSSAKTLQPSIKSYEKSRSYEESEIQINKEY